MAGMIRPVSAATLTTYAAVYRQEYSVNTHKLQETFVKIPCKAANPTNQIS